MLTRDEKLLAVLRNIEQWNFELFPKFELSEDEARVVASELKEVVGKRIVADYQKRHSTPDLDCVLRD